MELNQEFERERLQQEKDFITEMFENYAKLHGASNEEIQNLLKCPADEPAKTDKAATKKKRTYKSRTKAANKEELK
jgi:hypothetical protein